MRNKVWDSPAYNRTKLKYRDPQITIIFNPQNEINKPSKYSLGKLTLAGQDIKELPSHRISYRESDGYNYIPDGEDNLIGRVIKEGNLWKYESLAEYSSSAVPQTSKLEYYTESVLKNLSGGRVYRDLHITSLASVGYNIVAPPQLGTRKEIKREVAVKAYGEVCKYREACILSKLEAVSTTQDLFYAVVSHTKTQAEAWQTYIMSLAEPLFNNSDTGTTILENYLNIIDGVRDAILLEDLPKYKRARLIYEQEYARPIFNRLPGSYRVSDENIVVLTNTDNRLYLDKNIPIGTIVTDSSYGTAYKYLPRRLSLKEDKYQYGLDPLDPDQVNSPADPESWVKAAEPPVAPVTDWLTSGVDLLLSDSKEKIDQFFHDILDPRTCDDRALDWICQFFGFTGDLWREDWEPDEKRSVLLNSFGWYNSSLTNELTAEPTLKGEVTNLSPFNNFNQLWVDSSADSNIFQLLGHELTPQILEKSGLLYEPVAVDSIKVAKEDWPGLHESKGTLLNLMWWLSNFRINAPNDSTEIEVKELIDETDADVVSREAQPIGNYTTARRSR